MPIENSWGKSAVDATRKNALPPYLDELFESGLGSGVRIINIDMPSDAWTSASGYYYQNYYFNNDEKGKPTVPPTATIIAMPRTYNWSDDRSVLAPWAYYGIRANSIGTDEDQENKTFVQFRARIQPSVQTTIRMMVIS